MIISQFNIIGTVVFVHNGKLRGKGNRLILCCVFLPLTITLRCKGQEASKGKTAM